MIIHFLIQFVLFAVQYIKNSALYIKLYFIRGEEKSWGFLGIYKVKKIPNPVPKNPQNWSHIFYRNHQVPARFLLKIIIVINVHKKMKLFTYEVYDNIQHVQFKLDE